MKILALNGSPRLRASGTYHMLEHLLAGMEEAGAEVEILHVRKLDLKACIGCYTCWVRTPGKCIFDDSMTSAIEKYNNADMVVFGTPLYHFSMTGILKDFIDRTLTRLEPWLIPHPDIADTSFHPERFHKPTKMMLVSPCGFPEFEHFDSLVATFKQMARMERMDYLGEILRPGAEALSSRSHQDLFRPYYALVRQAGIEVIEHGRISSELQAALREDLFPGGKQAFYGLADNYWSQQMDRFKVPADQRHTVPILASDLDSVPFISGMGKTSEAAVTSSGRLNVTNEQLMRYLAGMFNPLAIPELRATIQFTFSPSLSENIDCGTASWYLNIHDGVCEVHEGKTAMPTLSINTPHDVWQDIGAGSQDAESAFTDGDFNAEGSMTLMAQFPQIFQYPQPEEGGGASPELDMIMLGMPVVFKPEVAGDLEGTIEFVLGGHGGGIYYLTIADGQCTAQRGSLPGASLSINTPAETWMAIARGELDGQQTFMAGDMRATGDMNIMLKLGEMFATGATPAQPLEGVEAGMQPTVDSSGDSDLKTCRETVAAMTATFNPKEAGDISADIQFNVNGQEPGTYFLSIQNQACSFHEGTSTAPVLTINTPSDVWIAVSNGRIEGATAFMESMYTAEGDFALLMRMSQLFDTAS